MQTSFYYYVTFLLSFLVLESCTHRPLSDREKASLVISQAGDNSKELEKVITHYNRPDDSIKLKAAYYLIANLPGKGWFHYDAFDSKNSKIEFEKYCKLKMVGLAEGKKLYEDSAQTIISFRNRQHYNDIDQISGDFLIENIDFAFKSWKLPLARQLSFDQFKELILPYRVENEPLTQWRKDFFYKLSRLSEYFQKNSFDRFLAAKYINDSLLRIYSYKNNVIRFFPGELSLSEIEFLKGGRCEDLNVLVGYWLRTVGVPFATEYTPYWGNSDGGHSWLGVLNESNQFAIMNALYDSPKIGIIPFDDDHPVKIFRKKFEVDGKCFHDFIKHNIQPPDNSYDITRYYIPVVDFVINEDTLINKDIRLGVLNGLTWRPLETNILKTKRKIVFKDIGTNCLYTIMNVLPNGELETLGLPFLIDKNGFKSNFITDTNHLDNAIFEVSRFKKQMGSDECEIYIWDSRIKKWTPTSSRGKIPEAGMATIDDRKIKSFVFFKNIPRNAVYRILNPRNGCFSRPYIFIPGSREISSY